MELIDWAVLSLTLTFIIVYGVWKNNAHKNIKNYIRGGNRASWFTVGSFCNGHTSQCHYLFCLPLVKLSMMGWALYNFILDCLLPWSSSACFSYPSITN